MAVYVWRENMELAGPIVFYGHLVGLDGLVFEDSGVNSVAAILEPRHDKFVRRNVVSVVPGLEGLYQNGIGVDVVCQYNLMVAAEGSDREAAHVVCVELADGLNEYV